ncbi:unnamed protein product [Effrenium voratum]|nr:unnamed protein product [Effrenium voratum]
MPLCYRSMPWRSGLKGSDATHGAFYGILRQLGDGVREFGCDAESAQAELAQLSSQSAPTEEEAATLRAQALLERKKCEQLRSEIQAYERCGPAKLAEMKKQTAIAKDAANRWADNICAVRSLFLRERRGEVSAVQFNQTFGLPEDFDYLE